LEQLLHFFPAQAEGEKKMLRIEDQIKRMAAFASVVLMATAEAMAQENLMRPTRRIVVSIPDRKLAVIEDDRVVRIFDTAVGAPHSPSPAGVYKIVNSIEDPTWYTKGRTVPRGPGNPLGTRWLGLSVKGYGIHGTNVPSSIGKNASHGCIRMRNRDVEQLFKMVAVGDEVQLVGERSEELARIFAPAPAVTTTAAVAVTGDNNNDNQ
jgi:lipoprotein-anchoring transpeptidase ErfK/SrfK